MLEISYWPLFVVITAVFTVVCAAEKKKNKECFKKSFVKLILLYISTAVIFRIVYFPMHHVNGHIDTLKFDASRILPFKKNLVPFVHLFDKYDGWLINLLGNIMIFIPLGIIWSFCFKKLDSILKTTLAGAGFSLFIEISQLLFYDRCTDVDDLFLNTTGFFIGALIYFAVRWMNKRNTKAV